MPHKMSIIKKQIRVRFAPSPTGFLHIGGLRTALYNYLFARKNKGKFILRIEDTDRERTVRGGIENIINTLRQCGLDYDEGPEIGGKYSPYVQSERLDFYKKYAKELLAKNAAYYCFCAPKELEEERKERQRQGLPTKYSGKCLNLSKKEINDRLAKKAPYVVRLYVPEEGSTEFDDLIYGKITVENKNIDHQVLMKSDGYPTYHLANIVDDHLMEISHVIRGEEWLPSTPKHILLYKAFGWQRPQFAHLPLILNPDKSKLSKRQGDVAVGDFLKKGYLPEALLNFVALLGWNPKGDQEIYSLKELTDLFNLSAVNKAGAVFNQEKLYWMNGDYIRRIPLEKLTDLCIPYLVEAELIEAIKNKRFLIKGTDEIVDFEWLKKCVKLEQERMRRLDEIPQLVAFLFIKQPDYGVEMLLWKQAKKEEARANLETLYKFLSESAGKNFMAAVLEDAIKKFLKEQGMAAGAVLWPMRVALSGLLASPSPFDIAEVLGKEKTLLRIEEAIKKL